MNKQAQAIEKAIAVVEKEIVKMSKGYREGKNQYSFALDDALIYLKKAQTEADCYNYENLKY